MQPDDSDPEAIVCAHRAGIGGSAAGEEGGARLMLKEGLLQTAHQPAAIFGLHVWPGEAGSIGYRSGPAMAAAAAVTGCFIDVRELSNAGVER